VDPVTRTMRVEIDVPNPKEQVRPGMRGTASIRVNMGGGLSVPLYLPASCVLTWHQNPAAVYVVKGGKAHRTSVMVDFNEGEKHYPPLQGKSSNIVVYSGLKAGDLVVADPKGLTEAVVPVKVKDNPTRK
jgi:multidrug efflux pump subunit AcrA (membrane-fusion protein)